MMPFHSSTSLITVLMIGLQMFSDPGIAPLVIRSPRGNERSFLDTIWTVQLVRGAIIWLVALAAAVPFSSFYEAPELTQLIPVAALIAIIDTFAPTKQYTAQRNMEFGRLTMIDLVAQVFGLAVQVGLALVWPTVWSLVIGSLANAVACTLLLWVVLDGPRNRLCWEKQTRAERVGFGRWLFVSTVLTFASLSLDQLFFGRVLSLQQLGVYGNGKVVASQPAEAMSRIGSSVVYPFYSTVVNSGQPLAPAFKRARWPLLVVSGAGLALLTAIGQPLIEFMYDDRDRAAGPVVQILALGGWFNVLVHDQRLRVANARSIEVDGDDHRGQDGGNRGVDPDRRGARRLRRRGDRVRRSQRGADLCVRRGRRQERPRAVLAKRAGQPVRAALRGSRLVGEPLRKHGARFNADRHRHGDSVLGAASVSTAEGPAARAESAES